MLKVKHPPRKAPPMEKIIRKLYDDVEDGEVEAVGSVEFSYKGGGLRRIDLNAKNMARIDADFQKWLEHSRPADGKIAARPSSKGARVTGSGYNSEQLAAIRDWARRNGHQVSPKGRIAADIIAAFEADMTPAEPSRIFSET